MRYSCSRSPPFHKIWYGGRQNRETSPDYTLQKLLYGGDSPIGSCRLREPDRHRQLWALIFLFPIFAFHTSTEISGELE